VISRACVLAVTAALALGAADADAAPRALFVAGPVATLPGPDPAFGISAVRTDREGRIFVAANERIAAFTPQGALIRAWSIPSSTAQLMDVLPDGTVLALAPPGNTVYRYDAAGNGLGSWTAPELISTLAVDPRGSVVIGSRRFSPDGRDLGPVGLPVGRTVFTGDGGRWVVDGASISGITPAGHHFQTIGRPCPPGHSAYVCPGGVGGFGGGTPTDIAAAADGRFATVEAGLGRLQFFDRRGRVQFACSDFIGPPLTAVAYDRASDDVLIAVGRMVYRAKFTTMRAPTCTPAPLRITGVRARSLGKSWRISYRLSRSARVELVFSRTSHRMSVRRRGRRGLQHVRVPRARGRGWYVQIKAWDAQTNAADAPLMRLPR
jgi:hypothetical protein